MSPDAIFCGSFGCQRLGPEELLNLAAAAIDNRPPSITKVWILTFKKDRLQCLPKFLVPPESKLYYEIHDSDLLEGLTNKQWDRLRHALVKFFKESKP